MIAFTNIVLQGSNKTEGGSSLTLFHILGKVLFMTLAMLASNVSSESYEITSELTNMIIYAFS